MPFCSFCYAGAHIYCVLSVMVCLLLRLVSLVDLVVRSVIVAVLEHLYYNIGIKHGFSCINIRQVLWEVLKTEAGGRGFQHLPRNMANVNALKNHVRSL